MNSCGKMANIEFDFSPRTEPLSHQIEAIEFIRGRKNIPLFDEQGLGKSKIVIDALCCDLHDDVVDSVLIVCKKGLLDTWQKEVSKHSHLQSTVLRGSKRLRGRSFMHFNHFYLIGYETFISELERIQRFLTLRRFAIVLDESQKIKNPDSQVTQAIFRIRESAIKRIIITGTPIANRPEDLWSQFYFLDGGKTLGTDFRSFKKEFGTTLKAETTLKKYEPKMAILRDRVAQVAMRRTKDILELPEKVYRDEFITLSSSERQMYERAKTDLLIEIKDVDGKTIAQRIDNYLVKLLRLTQIASNAALVDDSYMETPAKLLALDTMLKGIVAAGEKAIVWTSFRKNIRSVRRRYKEYGALMLFGDIPIEERTKVVEKFMSQDKHKVLVANPSAAKEGLTLTSANHAIYLDRTFKMDDYIQSQDRIHRIGQKKKCNIVRLIADDTIDEYTDEILEKKYMIAQFALGDTPSMEANKEFLTKEDLLKILG